jgi:hypothetical protein
MTVLDESIGWAYQQGFDGLNQLQHTGVVGHQLFFLPLLCPKSGQTQIDRTVKRLQQLLSVVFGAGNAAQHINGRRHRGHCAVCRGGVHIATVIAACVIERKKNPGEKIIMWSI